MIIMIDEAKIKGAGAVGVTKSGTTQVIIGTQVQQVADEIERQMEKIK